MPDKVKTRIKLEDLGEHLALAQIALRNEDREQFWEEVAWMEGILEEINEEG